MSTTVTEINQWFDDGVKRGATHMIVVCDTFDHTDYPVYVMPGTDAREEFQRHQSNMQRVMEVYSLKQDKAKQLTEHRAFHFD